MGDRAAPPSAVARALGAFGTRRAALDFGFFKLNLPERGVALLVDFIVRREAGLLQVRASLHAPAGAGVYWREGALAAARLEPPGRSAVLASTGPCWLGPRGSLGTVGPVSWELTFRPEGGPLVPVPRALEPLRPVDMWLASAPSVRFDGEIAVGDARHPVSGAAGMVSSYYGRRLPPRWTWISCGVFERPGVTVECMVAPTRLFGRAALELESGYFHVRDGDTSETVLSPLNGRVRVAREDGRLVVTARRRGAAERRLVFEAPPGPWHDLGEGIRNTLVGSCDLDGLRARGTAALEEREAGQQAVEDRPSRVRSP